MAKKTVKTYKVKNKSTKLIHTVPEGHFSLKDKVNYEIIGKKPLKKVEGDAGDAGDAGDGTE